MKTATRKLRSPLKWHGGKSYLARRIIGLMPPHRVYVEPFVGGGSVLLNKPEAQVEVAGDANPELINFWTMLRDRRGLLLDLLNRIPYCRESWDEWVPVGDPNVDSLVRAVEFIVRNRFSRGGLGEDFAWSDRLRGKSRPGGPVPGDVNAWDTIREEMPRIADRIALVDFQPSRFCPLIHQHDGPETLFYCDPPYLHETRTATDAYAFEMDRKAHEALLDDLIGRQGTVMLSGYHSPLYDAALADWTLHEFEMPNHSGQGKSKQRRVECLWIKPSQSSAR